MPQVSWKIRTVTNEDAPRLQTAQSWPGAPHWPRDAWQVYAGQETGALRRALLVADDHRGDLCGWVAGTVLDGVAELEFLIVAPEARGRGLGAHLLKMWQGWAAGKGAEQIFLEVRASNLPALRLYERIGFREQGRRRAYYADPVEDAVLMRLSPVVQGSATTHT